MSHRGEHTKAMDISVKSGVHAHRGARIPHVSDGELPSPQTFSMQTLARTGHPSRESTLNHDLSMKNTMDPHSIPYPTGAEPYRARTSSRIPPDFNMGPVLEPTVKTKSGSRPATIQLPSPPSSPPLRVSPASLSRTRSQRSNSQSSQPLVDPRFSAVRARPTFTTSHSTPSTSLPFRPSQSTTSTPKTSPTGTIATHPISTPYSAPTPSLTKHFRHDSTAPRSLSGGVTVDGTQSFSTTEASSSPMFGSVASRSRSASIASEIIPSKPTERGSRSSNVLRRASIAVTGGPRPMGPRTSAALSRIGSPLRGVVDDDSRAETQSLHSTILRNPGSRRATTHYEDLDLSHDQRAAYFSTSQPRSRTRSQLPGADSSISPFQYALQPSGSASQEGTDDSGSHTHIPPRRGSVSRGVSPKAGQPALVPRKDSAALRPLPPSAFSRATFARSHSRQNSLTDAHPESFSSPYIHSQASRSRAGSFAVVSFEPTTEDISEEGSISEESKGDRASRRSLRSLLPPLDPIPSMEFDQLSIHTRGH